jgi:hypothetical protein
MIFTKNLRFFLFFDAFFMFFAQIKLNYASFFILMDYLPQPLPHPQSNKRSIKVQQSIPQPPLPLPQRHCKIIIHKMSEQQSHPPTPKPFPQPPPQLLLKKFMCSS